MNKTLYFPVKAFASVAVALLFTVCSCVFMLNTTELPAPAGNVLEALVMFLIFLFGASATLTIHYKEKHPQ